MMTTTTLYTHDGDTLRGEASALLVLRSLEAADETDRADGVGSTVLAYREGSEWHYVPESRAGFYRNQRGEDVIGVRVEVDMDARIGALRTAAGEAGDLEQVAVCDRALGGDREAVAACVAVIMDVLAQRD